MAKEFNIEYKHLTNSSLHLVKCDNLKDAQLIWDIFKHMHNHYAMVSPRPDELLIQAELGNGH